ncbi:activating signal cointegrator 1 complex subunit 3-like [Diadema setosum]|uniref:activating signal cointegrator 1 complex subunit 3-like n=1 Tax=Diadema setosum TaxID=31175 RepID=UPI003B3A7E89
MSQIDLPSNSKHRNKHTYEEVVILPPEITTAIRKPDLIPVAELDKVSRKAFRGMEALNLVQTIVFDAAYNTDENLLVCAPTGAGKTNIAMLAVLHEVRKHIQLGVVKTDEFKIVYVAPMKALAAEMVKTFGSRLRPLGISVKELTGDSRLTKREIMQSQMLVVTPEKWDVITRKCTGDATIIQLVKLLIIDEVHLLHEDRGAVIECLVARTLRQVEAYQNNVRIVGLSATLPNYRDVAEFLHVDLDKGLFFFDSRFRPVPLQQSFIGVKNLHSNKNKEKVLMNDVCYEKMIELVKNGHQVLIFVFSRAGTRETADELLKRLKREPTAPFSTETHESFEDAKKELEGLPDQILMDLVPKGLAVHHGGISRQSRDFVEKYFSAGLIRVLCCTTTLAWGVNLPAHAVIIKGTKFYNPDTSTQEDLGILDVLQIFGRAGRPQFDTFGEGYIITSRSKLRHYLLLLMTQDPIESKFKMRLADNLNAEIVLGTVSNMEEALRWLRYTYLYIRMRRSPEAYKLSFDDVKLQCDKISYSACLHDHGLFTMSLDTTTEVIQTDFYDVEQSNSSFVDDAIQSVTIREASFEVPFLASIILIGVFGNSLVIAVYGQRAFRASNASLHILNLAAGDLFLLVVVASLHISEFYKQTWFILWRTDAQCVLHRFARFIGFNLTIFEMMTIAIDRYMAVCHPLQFRVHCTTRRTKQKIALLWVVAVIAAIPTCLNYGTKFDVTALRNTYASRSPFACRTLSYFPKWFGEGKISYISIVLFFIPITVTAVIYVIIIIYVRRNNNQFVKKGGSQNIGSIGWNPETACVAPDGDERRFEDILKNLVTTSARFLQKAKMIKTERDTESFEYTEIGRIASHFYVTCGTIQHFNQEIPECRSEEEIFAMICGAKEFIQVKVRQAEEGELKDLLNLCEVYVSNARHIVSGETKVNILLQAYISHGRLKTFSLVSDMNYTAQSAARLMRAVFELALDAGRPNLADQVLKYTKAVDQRIWPKENPLYQLHSWECNRVIASDRSLTAGKLKEMDPCTIGSIVYGSKKKISKDEKSSCGLRVQGIARQLPFVSLDVSLQPLDHSTLRICLKVTPDFIWKDWKGGCGSERWWIWVENSREHRLHHYEYFSITKRQVQAKEPQDLFFNICLPRVRDVVYTVRAISEDWLGVEAQVSVRLDDFVMPSTNEFFSEPTKLDMTALWNNEFQKLFDFRHFNAIQQSVFDQVYTNSDGNVLLGAPSYSGKIVVAELAMLALFKTEPWSKVVYIAPLRALAMRRFTNWKSRFGDKLGKKVRMLNGDVISDASSIRFAEVIVTTAANWEAVSRKWETVRDVSLLILDGLQFLGDECGPLLEAIVARAKRMSKHTGRVVRLVGLSATMANAKDVARWLEVDDDHLFNFQSVHRPVKLELKVTNFSGKFCHIRTAAMNKPVYNAIKTTKKGVLVFVSSRKQATATAFELVAFLRHEENPQMWCRLKREEVDDMAASVSNQNLQLAVSYGVGVHHPGLSWSDRRTVEKLYRDKHLKVIVATKSLAWSSDLRARLVIVKGTEQYDARTQRYVDMPVTDLLQMIGRAGRYKKDSRGTALVMVQNTKRDFYHKALRAPVTIESRPDRTLPEYVNAEVVSGNITTEQDFENLLKTTFFYTRLTANPSYYGLPGRSERALKKFLYDVMESTLADLSNTQCIRRHRDEDRSVSALPLGRIASQNHVHHDTVKMVRDRLKPDSSIQDILTIISNAVEFAVMPVRYDEENINRTLSGKVRYPIDAPYADFTSPHTKANLLLQAHIGRVTLPCTDYESDTRNVLEYTDRILKVLVEIANMWKWYQTAMNVMYLTQAVVQAQWSSENSLLTLPHVQPTLISSFVSQSSGSGTLVDEIFGKEIESLKELISVCRGDKSALHAMLDGKLHQNQIEEVKQ